MQRTLTPAPWWLFAGSAYLDTHKEPQTPKDLQKHASLFMMRTGVAPVWRLRHASKAKADVVIRLTPRLLSDDMIGLKQAAIAGLGIVALPGYVCREDVRSGALRRVLPACLAGDSTITALIPYRQGLLPSVRVFIDHLAAEFPKAVVMKRLRESSDRLRRCPLEAEIVLQLIVRHVQHAPVRRASRRMSQILADEAVLDPEYRVGVQVLVTGYEHMGHELLVTGRRDHEMHVCGTPGMPPL